MGVRVVDSYYLDNECRGKHEKKNTPSITGCRVWANGMGEMPPWFDLLPTWYQLNYCRNGVHGNNDRRGRLQLSLSEDYNKSASACMCRDIGGRLFPRGI